jgi:hypothetical protein
MSVHSLLDFRKAFQLARSPPLKSSLAGVGNPRGRKLIRAVRQPNKAGKGQGNEKAY